tara:strand:+ start:3085 stop:3837 length:753 start_codon:yes stop_codon:yes gene_type:complete
MGNVQGRHDLLQSLGVSQWYSKYALPNTVITPDKLFLRDEELQRDVLGDSSLESSVAEVLKQPLAINSVMADLTSEKSSLPGLTADASGAIIRPATVVSLSLSMARFDDLLICYESIVGSVGGVKLEQALLLSIIKSLGSGIEGANELDCCQSFVWPPFLAESLQHDQSKYFELSLRCWLGSQGLDSVSRILYFGSNYSQIENVVLELRSESEAGFTVLPVAVTLSELLGAPVKKKSLWSVLSCVGVSSV